MASFKVHSAEVRRYGEPALIITGYDDSNARYLRGEYYVLVPDTENTLISSRLTFDVAAFKGAAVELTEGFVLSEALAQARIDLNDYLQGKSEQDKFIVSASPEIIESSINAIVAARMRDRLPQVEAVYKKTKVDLLADALYTTGHLPKIEKSQW